MTSFLVRVTPRDPLPSDSEVLLLDWFADQRAASTIQSDPRFLRDLAPGTVAGELLRLAAGAYCADKLALRRLTPDRWTRELLLDVPVSNPTQWQTVSTVLTEALDFLTGDRWTLAFREAAPIQGSRRLVLQP